MACPGLDHLISLKGYSGNLPIIRHGFPKNAQVPDNILAVQEDNNLPLAHSKLT